MIYHASFSLWMYKSYVFLICSFIICCLLYPEHFVPDPHIPHSIRHLYKLYGLILWFHSYHKTFINHRKIEGFLKLFISFVKKETRLEIWCHYHYSRSLPGLGFLLPSCYLGCSQSGVLDHRFWNWTPCCCSLCASCLSILIWSGMIPLRRIQIKLKIHNW